MNRTVRRKKGKFWKPVAAGFMALYLLTMGLATYLVKEKYIDEYAQAFEEIAMFLINTASEKETGVRTAETELAEKGTGGKDFEEVWGEEERAEFYQELIYGCFQSTGKQEMKGSAAVYDTEGKLLARSYDAIGDLASAISTDGQKNGPFALDDYLSFEQKEEMAEYYWKERLTAEGIYTIPEKYRFLIRTSSDGKELYDIIVQELTWEEGREAEEKQYVDPLTGSINSYETDAFIDYETGTETDESQVFYVTDSHVVWEWTNPDVQEGQKVKGRIQNASIKLSSMKTFEEWRRWSSSEYLHGYPEKGEFYLEEGNVYRGLRIDSDGFYYRCRFQGKVWGDDNPYAYIEVRMEERPWIAAFDYMKYVFLAGLVLAVGCMIWIVRAFNRTYDRQMALEATRRDLTNAMAHELKTPLGIIRNFAENLIEYNMEEKRDYYLAQIIGQTEEMDHLVADMIEIAKLDSEELALKKENVSFAELIREQMERFAPLIEEKNLQVQYRVEADLQIDGDREYLAKAVWNLLSNAVEYNVSDGRIIVAVKEGMCSIENTGAHLSEEQIMHAFDLFYTGDKSRGKKVRHMGLGLFLAKRIFGLHGIGLSIENTDEGVRAVMQRGRS
ncbi:MAG: HAMP domain-containing histidine kinase [Dorea sp.]|nr:HAMP domain-containing histidine kinase [Dorea sp.]